MSTMTGIMRRAVLSGIASAVSALALVGVARADVASDKPGAILIFPKLVVDSNGILNGGVAVDTEVQIINASNSVIGARCFIVNTTSYCSSDPGIACRPELEAEPSTRACPIGDTCNVGWVENDFDLILTKRQPISWRVSQGLPSLPCDGITRICSGGNNTLPGAGPSAIPPASTDPFYGEIKCIEADPATLQPTRGLDPANGGEGDLFGYATIVRTASTTVDASKYNAITIGAVGSNDGNDTLTLGPGLSGEYSGCPNFLLMDHLFDGATIPTHRIGGVPTVNGTLTTDLTVIPCSQDFAEPSNLGGATLQFLVYNEFEQRFSTSTSFQCWREVQLSDIDTRPGPVGNAQSIFSASVQGTLAGQTRIRPVAGVNRANGILAVSEEFWQSSGPGGISTNAANVHFVGVNETKGDLIILPTH